MDSKRSDQIFDRDGGSVAPVGLGLRMMDMVTGMVATLIVAIGVSWTVCAKLLVEPLESEVTALGEALEDVSGRLSNRPRIVFMNYSEVVELVAAGATPEDLEGVLSEMRSLENELVQGGAIVLNTSALVGAPDRYRVSIPETAEVWDVLAARSGAHDPGGLSGVLPDLFQGPGRRVGD